MPNFTDIYEDRAKYKKMILSLPKSQVSKFKWLAKLLVLTDEELIDSLVCAYFEHVLKVQSLIEPKTRLPKQMIPEFEDDKDFFFYVSDLLKKQLTNGMHEGGMLDEELREKKFDVIVGNPPYTHLRGLGNRRYAAYPKQRDMAQVFMRWALDHMVEDGVIGYNTSDAWLSAKISDGAKETRKLVDGKIAEIVQDEEVMRYSEQDGGNIGTMIMCCHANDGLIYNGKLFNEYDILSHSLFSQFEKLNLPYKHILASDLNLNVKGYQGLNEIDDVASIFVRGQGDEWYLCVKRIVGKTTSIGKWQLVVSNDITDFIASNRKKEIKACCLNRDIGRWLLGFLNCQFSLPAIKKTFRGAGKGSTWVRKIDNSMFQYLPVPDFDYYKQNRPERFESYMKWIEENMHDKDKFLAGIDAEFEALIA